MLAFLLKRRDFQAATPSDAYLIKLLRGVEFELVLWERGVCNEHRILQLGIVVSCDLVF